MLQHRLYEQRSILYLHPTAALRKEDFVQLAKTVDSHIEKAGSLAGLILDIKAFPGWEAIKSTRGHYRSCGKDPAACCVSHLLSDHPLVRSGRDQTYE